MDQYVKLILALAAITVTTISHAQITTLDYTGQEMTGTITYGTGTNFSNAALGSAPYYAAFNIQMTVSGSMAQNDLEITSLNFGGTGLDFQGDAFDYSSLLNVSNGSNVFCDTNSSEVGGCVTLQVTNNSVTGALIGLIGAQAHQPHYVVGVGPLGDQFSSLSPTFCGYGPFYNLSCGVSVSGGPGTWTATTVAAPELPASSTAGALALLIGGLIVHRSKR